LYATSLLEMFGFGGAGTRLDPPALGTVDEPAPPPPQAARVDPNSSAVTNLDSLTFAFIP
jgi:hypothetical protein